MPVLTDTTGPVSPRPFVSARARHARRARAAVAALLVAALTTVGLVAQVSTAPPAEAAITTPFAARFAANTNGDIIIRGNSFMTCPTGATNCAAARAGTATGAALNNNNYNMTFVDVDDVAATRSSSQQNITLPSSSTVLFAGLYWSGYTTAAAGGAAPPSGTAQNRLLLRAPGDSAYRTVTASTVMSTGGGASYQSFADVTSVVAGARSGTYTAADIFAGTGQDRYGAWSLVIAYGDPNLPARNLTVFDGYGVVQNTAADRSATIPISGFTTPSTAPFTTRMGAVVYEGDAGFDGDQFSITRPNGTTLNLGNDLNPVNNVFNSNLTDNGTYVPGRNPGDANMFGYDGDVFQGQLLNPGDRSATLNLTTGNETYFPGVVTFATDLQAPTLSAVKSQTPVDVNNDGVIGINDRIQYSVRVQNTGRDAAINSVLADPLPTGTTLVPGTLTVDGAAVTPAADADRGELVDNAISVRLGSSPGTTGGRLEVGAVTTVAFTVEIGAGLADGTAISNRASLRYTGAQTGQQLSGSSSIVTTPFTAPRSDLQVSKSSNVATVQRDGERAVTYTVRVRNAGPDSDSGVTLVDALPVGFTLTSTPTGCTVSGRTLTCAVGAMAVGATAVRTVAGTLAANAPDPAVNTATANGSSVDPTPANNEATANVAVNTPPVAGNDTATVAGGAGSSVDIAVLSNDSDPDGDPLTVRSAFVTGTPRGTVAINANGTLTYTVTDPAFKGTDTVTYQVCDNRGGCTNATVVVTVQNQAPSAQPDFTRTAPNTPVTADVLANDRDPNGDALTVTVPQQPAGGTATVNPDGTITVTPNAGFTGPLTVSYQVCDPDGGCNSSTLTVTVDNASPDAVDQQFETPFQTALTLTDAQLLAGATDPNPGETAQLVVASVQAPSGGTVSREPATGVTTFTPAPGFTGEASFTYTIRDPAGNTATATVFVTVPNTAPVTQNVTRTVVGPEEVSIGVADLATDAQSPAADLRLTVTTLPGNGSVRVENGQVVFYGATPEFKGVVSFGYQVCDPQGLCGTGTVSVTVENQAPVANDNTRTVRPGETIDVPVLLNDTDPNGDELRLSAALVSGPAHGTAIADPATGLIRYTPGAGRTDPVEITYEVCDVDLTVPKCATAVLRVSVVNSPPTARNDAGSAFHDAGQPTVVRLPVLANDEDPDGETFTIDSVAQPVTGSAEIDGDDIVYTAPTGFIGTVVFSYTISDASGGTAQALITVTIQNRAPVVVDDVGTLDPGTSGLFAVLGNDDDPDGDPLELRLLPDEEEEISGPGTAALENGQIRVTSTGASGDVVVPYLACDPFGSCSRGVLTVSVGNSTPVAVNDELTTPFGTPLRTSDASLLANDTDANGDRLTVVSVQDAQNGTVTRDAASGEIVFTPAAGYVGTGSFTYTVTDGVATSTATVFVSVPNTPPTARDDQAGTRTNTAVTIDVLANDTDAETPDDLTVTIVDPPPAAQGSVSVTGSNQVEFTPATGFSGTVTFTYEVCDPYRACAAATVTVEVDDEAPVAVEDLFTSPFQTDLELTDADLLANDVDLNGDDLTVTSVQDATGGTVTRDAASGTIVFTPATGFIGTATFTYTITDGQESSTATVYVVVPSTPPVAEDDVASTAAGTPVDIDVLADDSDAETPNEDLELTVLEVSAGTAEVVDRQIRFTPADGFSGIANIRYQICDPQGLCVTAGVTVTVDGLPTAVDDAFTTTYQASIVLTDAQLLVNDTDPENGALRVVSVQDATGGTVTRDNETGLITFTPADGFIGTASFTYTLTDGRSESTATVRIEVPNDAPVANDDRAGTRTNTPVTIPILANDSDAQTPREQLSVSIVQGPTAAQGTAELADDNQLRFAPADGFAGTVEIVYEVCDTEDACARATVTIVVDNEAPVAGNDRFTTTFQTPLVIDDARLLANDIDLNGDTRTVVSVQGATDGTVARDPDTGVIIFTPDDGFTGTASFTYTITDGTTTSTATVLVDVPNTRPVARDDQAGTPTGDPVTIPVLANDTDAESGPGDLEVTVTVPPTDGTAVVTDDNQILYTPPAGFAGTVRFEYEVCDPQGLCDTATVTVVVDNAAPLAQNDLFTTPFQTALTLTPAQLLANDTDANGDELTVVSVQGATNGTVNRDSATGAIIFTPASGFVGEGSFLYTITDGTGTSTARVTVLVPNTPPAPEDLGAATGSGSPVTIDVVTDGTDAESPAGALALRVVASTPGSGTAEVVNGQLRFTPAAGFTGTAVIVYEVCDPQGLCTTGTVTITVDAAPDAVDDAFTGTFGRPVTLTDAQLLVNDTDPEGDALSVVSVQGATGGAVVRDPGTGLITFTPAVGFLGEATFTYTITDGFSESTATVTITFPNTAPVANDDTAGTATNTPVTVDVLANDTDAETPGELSVGIVQGPTPSQGTAEVVDGRVVFTPAAGFAGTVAILYEITDPQGLSDTATLTVVVDNEAPVAGNDRFTTPFQTPLTLTAAQLLVNDTDPNGDTLTVVSVQDADDGTVTRDPDTGVITFTPADGFLGTASFTYTITDTAGNTSTATVLVNVPNTAPVARDDQTVTPTDTAVTIDVLANDTDAESPDELSVEVVGDPASGTAEVIDGQVVFTPAPGFSGTVRFSYEICDTQGLCDTATVTVVVSNSAPVANNDLFSTPFQTALTLSDADLLANDSDANGDDLTVVSVQGATNGTVTRDPDTGTITFVPATRFVGEGSFLYTITDGTGTSTARVTVLVPNTAPVAVDDTATTGAGSPISVNVLANDSDAESPLDQLTPRVVTVTAGTGTAEVVDRLVRFTPADGFTGTARVLYEICDPQGLCDTATVTITVDAPPNAVDESFTGVFGQTVTLTDARLLANDTDPDSDTLTIVSVQDATGGTVSRDPATGVITFTPADGFLGEATFTYTITDGFSESTATVTITFPNTAPVARDDTAGTRTGIPVTVDVRANDTDAETPDDLMVTVVEGPSPTEGTAAVVDDQIVFTPADGFAGTVDLVYEICDPQGLCDTATVTIVVDDEAPVAAPDLFRTPYQTAVDLTDDQLLANDVHLDGGDLMVVSVQDATNGTVTRDADTGLVTFTPSAGFIGDATFTYTIVDAAGNTSTATVTIVVDPVPPVAVDDRATTRPGVPVVVDVVDNDSSGDGSALELVAVGTVPGATTAIEDNQLLVTPDPDFTGELEIPYVVCQADGQCTDAVAIVVVEDDSTEPPTTDPPTTDPPTTDPPTTDPPPTTEPPTGEPTDPPTAPTDPPTDPTDGSSDPGTGPGGGGAPDDDASTPRGTGPGGMPGTGAAVTAAAALALALLLGGAVLLVVRRHRANGV